MVWVALLNLGFLIGASLASAEMWTVEKPLCCPPGQYLRIYADTTTDKLQRYSDGCFPIPENHTIDGSTYTGYQATATKEGAYSTAKLKPGEGVETPLCNLSITTTTVARTQEEIIRTSDTHMDGWYVGHGKEVNQGVEFDKLYRYIELLPRYYYQSRITRKRFDICGIGFNNSHADTLCQKLGFEAGTVKFHKRPSGIRFQSLNISSNCLSPKLSNCQTRANHQSSSFTDCRDEGENSGTTAGLLCTGRSGNK